MRLSWRLAGPLLLLIAACGGTAIVDPPDGTGTGGSPPIDDDDGSGAGTPTGTATGLGGSGGMPFEPDGVVDENDDGVGLRVVSFPISCSTADIEPPFGECNWYDLEIRLFIDGLVEGLVIPPSSGQGTAFISAAGMGNNGNCAMSGGGGELFGQVSILEVESDRVLIELGPEWEGLVFDGPSLAGEHWLARCN